MNTVRPSTKIRRSMVVPGPKLGYLLLLAGVLLLILISLVAGQAPSAHAAGVPRPDHIVLVIEENHSYSQIIGNSCCPTSTR